MKITEPARHRLVKIAQGLLTEYENLLRVRQKQAGHLQDSLRRYSGPPEDLRAALEDSINGHRIWVELHLRNIQLLQEWLQGAQPGADIRGLNVPDLENDLLVDAVQQWLETEVMWARKQKTMLRLKEFAPPRPRSLERAAELETDIAQNDAFLAEISQWCIEQTERLREHPVETYVCNDCKDKGHCRWVWDEYNRTGDCLASK